MNVYYIELLNKSGQDLYVNVNDKQVGTIKAKDKFRYATPKSINKVELHSALLGSRTHWEGSIPAGVELEIFSDDGELNLYIENSKIPACVLDGTCPSPYNDDGCMFNKVAKFLIFILIIMIIISLIWNRKKYSSSK